MTIARKLALFAAVAAAIAALPDSAARAAGSGARNDVPAASSVRESTPEDLARSAYNAGVKQLRKAERYEEDAAKVAISPDKQEKARGRAQGAYEKALEKFQAAVSHQPAMHEAWNYIGFAQRHLGRHDTALASYGRALSLKPGFPEAVEYRGEAYLGLNRLDDARQAYMDLFAGSRDLAAQLLKAMQAYVAEHKEAPNGVDPQTLDSFARWVDERATLAQQTASLDTGAKSTSWR